MEVGVGVGGPHVSRLGGYDHFSWTQLLGCVRRGLSRLYRYAAVESLGTGDM